MDTQRKRIEDLSVTELKALAYDMNIDLITRQRELEQVAQLINQKSAEPSGDGPDPMSTKK